MDTKLTLRIDKRIIEQIKIYAMRHNRSVSAITEDLYKEVLINTEESKIQSPIAKKYKGILGKGTIDIDALKSEYLAEKHVK